MSGSERIRRSLEIIYGDRRADVAGELIGQIIRQYSSLPTGAGGRGARDGYFDQSDVVLITYGDTLLSPGETPLHALRTFLDEHLTGLFSAVHILPFFPYSSDDGFSVCDYHQVNPELGAWDEVESIESNFELMVDLVINHLSAESDWFRRYLADDPALAGLAIEVDPATDLSQVTRPRATPVLSPFTKDNGREVHLWTTFSTDQVDLNFAEPKVLAMMIEVLLFYVSKGARLIRLDAIAYLWKTIGTNCIHQPETHEVVKLMRSILDQVAPQVILITETNVPHGENVAYYGDGGDEAQMVYNFSLPPLLLHSFIKHDTRVMENWARRCLNIRSPDCTFFNFTASHDGIGMRPVEGIISPADIEALVNHARRMGGDVSLKRNPDGSESPYELNVTFVDAMREPDGPEGDAAHARRFLASQEIQLALPGVPAVYLHSLLGSRNWNEGVEQSGQKRRINRQHLDLELLRRELGDPGSFRALVFNQYCHLIRVRRQQPALHPNAELEVFHPDQPFLLAFKRSGGGQELYVLSNVRPDPLEVALADLGIAENLTDILGGQQLENGKLFMEPHRTSWLV